MKSFLAAAAILAASSAFAVAENVPRDTATQTTKTGVEEPSSNPQLNAAVVVGCYSSSGNLTFQGTQTWNSKSSCALDTCQKAGKTVAGTMGGNQCFCGMEYPALDTLVNDSNCNVGCSGYDLQACGGINFWTIYNTGIDLAVPYAPNVSTTTTTASTATPTTTVSQSKSVATQTSAATTTAASGSKGSSNTAGIAAGVVVAVVVVAGALGGLFFWMRRKRNQEIEEEHRRNAAVNAFIHGHKGGSSSAGSITDSRLDPVMAQRRMSDGSIADNEDYSRRILRVTNA